MFSRKKIKMPTHISIDNLNFENRLAIVLAHHQARCLRILAQSFLLYFIQICLCRVKIMHEMEPYGA